MKRAVFSVVLTLTASSCLAAVDLSKLPPPSPKKDVSYASDIRPILESSSCLRCHGDERPKAGLRLNSLDAALKGSENGKVIIPGKSSESPLVVAVSGLDEEHAMPPRRGPGRSGRGPGGNRPGGPGGPGGDAQPGAAPNARPSGSGQRGPGGSPAKPLTAEQVGLVRAWIDQGAK